MFVRGLLAFINVGQAQLDTQELSVTPSVRLDVGLIMSDINRFIALYKGNLIPLTTVRMSIPSVTHTTQLTMLRCPAASALTWILHDYCEPCVFHPFLSVRLLTIS